MIDEDDTPQQVRTQVAPPRHEPPGGAEAAEVPVSIEIDPDDEPDETKRVASREAKPPPGPGDDVGRYRIERIIGEGGMGRVYRAEDPQLGRFVALKILRPTLGAQAEDDRKRLIREAQALAKLTHPNLVRVYDVGTHEEQVFIAMEYVDGVTLDDWIHAKARPWPIVVKHLADAGRGLQAVHEAGIVHRDFKPGNVMVTPDDRVLVLDFGLARQAEESQRPEPKSDDVRPEDDQLGTELTRAGGIVGTPSYMAPEQHLGVRADSRTDQFSFCVSLYEALYRRRPFIGRSPLELMEAAIDGLRKVPPPVDDLPMSVRTAIHRGLRPERDDRFASMKDLVAVLDAAVHEHERPKRRWPVVVTALAVALTAVVTWRLATPSAARPTPTTDPAVGDAVTPDDGAGGVRLPAPGGGEGSAAPAVVGELPNVDDEMPTPTGRLDAGSDEALGTAEAPTPTPGPRLDVGLDLPPPPPGDPVGDAPALEDPPGVDADDDGGDAAGGASAGAPDDPPAPDPPADPPSDPPPADDGAGEDGGDPPAGDEELPGL